MNIIVHDGREEVLLRSGELCFEICKKVKTKDVGTGEEIFVWRPELYYGSLECLFHGLTNLKIKHSEATTLAELQEDLKRIRKEVLSIYGI